MLQADIQGPRPALGVLHAGTGGDFRRVLAGGGELDAVLGQVDAAPTTIDVIRVDYQSEGGARAQRYCLNLCGAGLPGTVVRRVNRSRKRLGGRATFFLASLRAVLDFHAPMLGLTLDGEALGQFRVQSVFIGNGQWAGGGMHLAPRARLADGALDVIVLRNAPLTKTIPLSRRLYDGSYLDSDLVHCYRGQALEVTSRSRDPVYLDIDGESPGTLPASFTVVPRAVDLLALDPRFA